MSKVEIVNQKGRKLQVELLAPNVAKHTTKTGNVDYWIRDPVIDTWKFAHQKRFDGMIKRFGTVEKVSELYVSPEGKKVLEADESHELYHLLEAQPKASRVPRAKKAKATPAKTKPKVEKEEFMSRSEHRASLREKSKKIEDTYVLDEQTPLLDLDDGVTEDDWDTISRELADREINAEIFAEVNADDL